jgi:ubiquinone/menaquinone biosynthesis C-methylase UbiE
MKMSPFEKRFVNSSRHSRRVAEQATRRVRVANPRAGQPLLDVGCGDGDATIALANTFGLNGTGVDIDPEQISLAIAASTGPADTRFIVADASDLPFADGEFDVVHTNKTTHHVRPWDGALAEMTRVLKPGGHLVYSDFVAPAGERLPTVQALERFAGEHHLQGVSRSRSPVHYTAVFRKADEFATEEAPAGGSRQLARTAAASRSAAPDERPR